MGKKLIPAEAIPEQEGQVVKIEGKDYLVMNDVMYTFFKRSMGEFSPFFLGLRDEKKILGCRCTVCGLVRVPPFLTRCPDCNFAPTEQVEVGDVGKMLSTPPITYFANSLFQQQVPFGRGRVVLEGADTALSVNVYTTRGILVPGIITKDTPVKVVFRDERVGEITDIFCVPVSELTSEQVAKRGLLNSELDWGTANEPPLSAATEPDRLGFQAELAQLKTLAAEMNDIERVRRDIADWERRIQVKAFMEISILTTIIWLIRTWVGMLLAGAVLAILFGAMNQNSGGGFAGTGAGGMTGGGAIVTPAGGAGGAAAAEED